MTYDKIPVSIQRCASYDPITVKDALNKVLDHLGGMSSFVSPGDRVLLKPNLLAPKLPEAAVTTHPEVVRAVALEVMNAGGEVFLGDSPAVGSLSAVLKKTGIMPVVQELGIQMVPFRTPITIPVPAGGVYKSFLLAEEATGYDLILNLPKFKTHGMMTLTLAVKNMFGTVVGAAKPGWHLQASDQARFADMLLDIWRTLPPGLSIMDGITAMEGNGPGSGDPMDLGILMASPSALAMDTVAGSVAGLVMEKHPVLYQAVVRGFEGAQRDQVKVLGEAIEDVHESFVLPKSASRVDFWLPGWMRRSMRKSLNSFPQLNPELCTSCGECAAICPADAIALYRKPSTGGVVDKDKCISCFCCQEVCPERAIDIVPGRLLRILKAVKMA
jgi:uncharacterized protein (DUF362 family)/Pyruvate/2-oxoacid:ferredoxin oxidoreductase delta subunit